MPRPNQDLQTMPKEDSSGGPSRDRGSYRHMLDFVSAANFRELMDGLLEGTGAVLAPVDNRHPSGRAKKKCWIESELEDYLKRHPLPRYAGLDRRWWIAFRGSRPTWDLICHLDCEDKPGLLLIEAKAHVSEMGEKNSKGAVDQANDRSIANDLSIRLRLAESNLKLNSLGLGDFDLSADHDYQLSNRVAYLHRLASDGVPTILMYLGWVGSTDWKNDPFDTSAAWEQAVNSHFKRVGPLSFIGQKRQLFNGTPFQMIVRSISPNVLS
jgi:hypothetical protein